MKTLQMVGIDPTEFILEIKKTLITDLTTELTKNFQPKQPAEFLTRKEVSKLLKVDPSTLHRWRLDGVIPSYGLGNRVYFKRNEVEDIINRNKLS